MLELESARTASAPHVHGTCTAHDGTCTAHDGVHGVLQVADLVFDLERVDINAMGFMDLKRMLIKRGVPEASPRARMSPARPRACACPRVMHPCSSTCACTRAWVHMHMLCLGRPRRHKSGARSRPGGGQGAQQVHAQGGGRQAPVLSQDRVLLTRAPPAGLVVWSHRRQWLRASPWFQSSDIDYKQKTKDVVLAYGLPPVII